MWKKCFFVLMVLCCGLGWGCSFSVPCESFCVTAPVGSGWDNWIVLVTCASSCEVKKVSAGESVFVQLEKNVPASVMLFPDDEDADGEETDDFTYGAVFPWCRSVSLWQGFSADVLRDFYMHSTRAGNSDKVMKSFASRYNWSKFCETVENFYAKDEFYNPWMLNRTKIMEALQDGAFSVNLLKMQ